MIDDYNWGVNPFRDFLVEVIKLDLEISNKEIENELKSNFFAILNNILDDSDGIKYFDFKITEKNDIVNVVGNNSISALWLSGIFIGDNIKKVLDNNTFLIDDKIYKYNNKTKKLSLQKIEN